MKSQSKSLVQHSGCKNCNLARKERQMGREVIIIKEICKFGGLVAVEQGSVDKYSCSQ